MGGTPTERSQWKEPLHSLEIELQTEFGLSAVASRALIRRLGEFLDTYAAGRDDLRGPGQILYPAVAVGERAGKPLRLCLTVPLCLTLLHPGDAQILHEEGSPALRRVRLARLCSEAVGQGAVLSYEDLSVLMAVEFSTVRRMVADLDRHGDRPPTRGLLADIGPTLTHKDQVIRLYFRGLLPNHIAARVGHSLGSVERYLADFARVAELRHRGLAAEAIGRITALSSPLVSRYLDLAQKLDTPANQAIWERLLRRFGPIEETPPKEVIHG